MDPVSGDILGKIGVQATKELVSGIIKFWEGRKKKNLTAADNREIAEVTQSLIHGATIEDVHRYNPLVQKLDRVSGKAPGSYRPPVKKAAGKKRSGVGKRPAQKMALGRKKMAERPRAKKR